MRIFPAIVAVLALPACWDAASSGPPEPVVVAPVQARALEVVAEVAPPLPAASDPAPVEVVRDEVRVGRIARNKTLGAALASLGVPAPQVGEIVGALKGVFDFRKSRVGDQLRVTSRGGQVEFVEYRKSAVDEWTVRREGERMVAAKRAIEVERRVASIGLTIEGSLYESMSAVGEDPALAVDIADVLAWDVDFYRDVRKGDRVRVVVEKFLSRGRLLRYGDVLGACYEGSAVGRKRYLRYVTSAGEASYFDGDGASAKKSFLKSPLKYVHITSHYGGRVHPLAGYYQQHQGVDFAAAPGTPVWAVADGVVTRLVVGDPGGGNYLFVRHANGLETGYLHLSGFADGVRTGARVRQKQVIAYSGNTGMSTGPHLHYAMKRGAQYINPQTQRFPRAEPLPKAELERFHEQTGEVAAMLDAIAVAAM